MSKQQVDDIIDDAQAAAWAVKIKPASIMITGVCAAIEEHLSFNDMIRMLGLLTISYLQRMTKEDSDRWLQNVQEDTDLMRDHLDD